MPKDRRRVVERVVHDVGRGPQPGRQRLGALLRQALTDHHQCEVGRPEVLLLFADHVEPLWQPLFRTSGVAIPFLATLLLLDSLWSRLVLGRLLLTLLVRLDG